MKENRMRKSSINGASPSSQRSNGGLHPLSPIPTALSFLSENSDKPNDSKVFASGRSYGMYSPMSQGSRQSRQSFPDDASDAELDKYSALYGPVLSDSTDDSSRPIWRSFSNEDDKMERSDTKSKLNEKQLKGSASPKRIAQSPRPKDIVLQTKHIENKPLITKTVKREQPERREPKESKVHVNTFAPPFEENATETRDSAVGGRKEQKPESTEPGESSFKSAKVDDASLMFTMDSLSQYITKSWKPEKEQAVKKKQLYLPRARQLPDEEMDLEKDGIEVVDGRLTRKNFQMLQLNSPRRKQESSVSVKGDKPNHKTGNGSSKPSVKKATAKSLHAAEAAAVAPSLENSEEKENSNNPKSPNERRTPDAKFGEHDGALVEAKPNKKGMGEQLTPSQRSPLTPQKKRSRNKGSNGRFSDGQATPDAAKVKKYEGYDELIPKEIFVESMQKPVQLSGDRRNRSLTSIITTDLTNGTNDSQPEMEIIDIVPTPASTISNKDSAPSENVSRSQSKLTVNDALLKDYGKLRKLANRRGSREIPTMIEARTETQQNDSNVSGVRAHSPPKAMNFVTEELGHGDDKAADLDIIDVTPLKQEHEVPSEQDESLLEENSELKRAASRLGTPREKARQSPGRIRRKKTTSQPVISTEIGSPNENTSNFESTNRSAERSQSPTKAMNVVAEEVATGTSQTDLEIMDVGPRLQPQQRNRDESAFSKDLSLPRKSVLEEYNELRRRASQLGATKRENDTSQQIESPSGRAKEMITASGELQRRNAYMNDSFIGSLMGIGGEALGCGLQSSIAPSPLHKNVPARNKIGTGQVTTKSPSIEKNGPITNNQVEIVKKQESITPNAAVEGSTLATPMDLDPIHNMCATTEPCDQSEKACSLLPKRMMQGRYTALEKSNKKEKKRRSRSKRKGDRDPVPIMEIAVPIGDESNGQTEMSTVSSLTNQRPRKPVKRVSWATTIKQIQTVSREREQRRAEKKKNVISRIRSFGSAPPEEEESVYF